MPVRTRTPSYRLHRPSGQAVVTLDGHDCYLGRFGAAESRAEYDRLVAEWLANGRRLPGADDGVPNLTLDELMLAYWRHVEGYYVKEGRPTSEPDTIRQALRFLRADYGPTPARAFGPRALKAVRQAMIEHGWSRSYINKQVNRIRRLFAWATENELVPVDVHRSLMTVAGLLQGRSEAREKPPVGPVPDELVERTLPALSPTVATMVRVQRLSGMRPQEVVLMQAAELDRSDPACWVYTPRRHKSEHHGRPRRIFLGPRVQELLRPYLEQVPGGYLFSPRRAEEQRRAERRARRKSPLTPSQLARRPRAEPKRAPGDCYDDGSYRKAIRRACVRLGLAIWFPHQLRHSAASVIRRRYGLEASQAVLGHADLGTTQVYAEADQGRARRVMAEIG
jgi:integrase